MNKPTIGGVIIVKDAVKYDYCILQSISSLAWVDKMIVIVFESEDFTYKRVSDHVFYSGLDEVADIVQLPSGEWDNYMGREKISYFQNMAAAMLDTDYYFLLQADEVLHPQSIPYICKLMDWGFESVLVYRRNLWKDCNHELFVQENRMPCSSAVIRLAKTKYKSVGDGESINAPITFYMTHCIDIWHYGFVRKKEVMKSKIINMQRNVFQIDPDPKLKDMEVFDWRAWFSESDLVEIPEESHPSFMGDWINARP